MSKRLLAIAAIAGLALLTTACSGQAAATQPSASSGAASAEITSPVTITLESYMPSLGKVGVDTLNLLVDNFQKQNPKVTVKIVADNATGSALIANYQREAATGALPDVGQVVFDTMRFSAAGLGAKPLEDIYGKQTVADFFGGDYPYFAPVAKLGVVDGKTYGVPWTLSTPVLFYNPNLLAAAGITDPPTTWDELAADAAKIKTATGAAGVANGCIGTAASGGDWCLQAILGSNGGGVLKNDKTTFDSKANISAITEMQKLASSGAMTDLTTQQMVQQFSTGKVAFVLNTAALQTTLLNAIGNSFYLKNTTMPAFAGKTATPTNSGSALEVFASDPAKQAAALKLIQYLTSPEAETLITTQVGYPPLRQGVATDEKYLAAFSTQHPLLSANVAQLAKIIPWQSYPGNNFSQIETLIGDAVTKSVFQNQDPATQLKSAQQQALALLG
jgi:multiple sugar transport system substrate-binding protein